MNEFTHLVQAVSVWQKFVRSAVLACACGLWGLLPSALMWSALLGGAQADDVPVAIGKYQGTLSQRAPGGETAPVRTFGLMTMRYESLGVTDVIYRLDDEGRSAIHWTQRFGNQTFKMTDATSGPTPVLQHFFDARTYRVKLPPLMLGPAIQVEDEASWDGAEGEFEVTGTRRVGNVDCWVVDVAGRAGHGQTLLFDQSSRQLVSATQRVVLGQGDMFELKLTLAETKSVPAGDSGIDAVTELLFLNKELKLEKTPLTGELTANQIDVIQQKLPEVAKLAKGTEWERFVSLISTDVAGLAKREQALAGLSQKFVGKAAPKFELKTPQGQVIDRTADRGQVVLLHFWSYRDEPLEEPYGQIGYIEFLRGKREKEGLKVYGIAVDPRFETAEVPAARRSVRKLKETMRTGYEITADAGNLLETFGDPVALGSSLPLWVVIGRDGKVIEYRTGYYEVDPRQGLRDLDALIETALKAPAP
ncbi:MAG: TlpA disulfide reductase family protein [Planctomycetaceae bacterium]